MLSARYTRTCATQVVKALSPRQLASVYGDPARLQADLNLLQLDNWAKTGPQA